MEAQSPIMTNSKFEAGVTSIQSSPHTEHLLAVGSYDSTVRLFDTRNLRVSVCHADVGGGAWRVKWHPSGARKNDLLVACMHDGFKVVRFSSEGSDATSGFSNSAVLERFDEHKSLAYGVDWSYHEDAVHDDTLIASCSFYDRVLYTWRG